MVINGFSEGPKGPDEFLYHLSSTCRALNTACLNALFIKYSSQYHPDKPNGIHLRQSFPSFILPAFHRALFLHGLEDITITFSSRPDLLGRDLRIIRSLLAERCKNLTYLRLAFRYGKLDPSPIDLDRLSSDLQELIAAAMVENSCRFLQLTSPRAFWTDTPFTSDSHSLEPLSNAPQTVYKRGSLLSIRLASQIYFERTMFNWTLDLMHQSQPAVVRIEQDKFIPSDLAKALRLIHLDALDLLEYTGAVTAGSSTELVDAFLLFLSRHLPTLKQLDLRLSGFLPQSGHTPFSNALPASTGIIDSAQEAWIPTFESVHPPLAIHAIDFRRLRSLNGDLKSINWVLSVTLNALAIALDPTPSIPQTDTTSGSDLNNRAPAHLSDTLNLDLYYSDNQSEGLAGLKGVLTSLALITTLQQAESSKAWRAIHISIHLIDGGLTDLAMEHAGPRLSTPFSSPPGGHPFPEVHLLVCPNFRQGLGGFVPTVDSSASH